MTIVASVKVRDGLVLGTDSMTQIVQANGGVLKTYVNARKLFQLGEQPIGVMTWGAGNVGVRSIGGLVNDFAAQGGAGAGATARDTAQALFDYAKPLYDAAFPGAVAGQGQDLGLYVAGYSPAQSLPEEYEFMLPRDARPSEVRPPDQVGSSWRGINQPFARIALGLDSTVQAALTARGLTPADIEQILQPVRMQVIFDGMPVQDAINYCAYILDTTIGWAAFHWGAQSCARPLQLATILEGGEFQWISPRSFTLPSMQPIGNV